MPTSAKPLWVLTELVLAFHPVLNCIYWPQASRSGGLPPWRNIPATIVA